MVNHAAICYFGEDGSVLFQSESQCINWLTLPDTWIENYNHDMENVLTCVWKRLKKCESIMIRRNQSYIVIDGVITMSRLIEVHD